MTKAIYKILAKTWPKKQTNKQTNKQWGATSHPNPSFVDSKCLVRTLGRPRSRVRRRRMQHPQGGSIGCWPQWVSPVNAAWAKLGRRCFQALIGLVWRRIHLWQNLNFLALRFFEPLLPWLWLIQGQSCYMKKSAELVATFFRDVSMQAACYPAQAF